MMLHAYRLPNRVVAGPLALGMLLSVLLVSRAAAGTAPQPGSTARYQSRFEATVQYGPHKGFALVGALRLNEKGGGGEVEGVLVHDQGYLVTVTGQITGRAVNLIFQLGPDQNIFGVGTLFKSVSEGGPLEGGGSFVGTDAADFGSWASFFGGGGGGPTCSGPVIKNPTFGPDRLFIDAGGSCIQLPATLKVSVPFSTTTYLFPLNYDLSGGRFQATSNGTVSISQAIPAGTCRVLNVINPGGQTSAAVTFCR